MSVSVVVPFRADWAERSRNWRWLKARYRRLYPDWEIVLGTDPDPGWRKGVAVADAVERATGDVLIVADADVFVEDGALPEAVGRLADVAWVVPHPVVYRLNHHATGIALDGGVWHTESQWLERVARRGAPGGGIAVVRRRDFDLVGGIDGRFEGWGGEDLSFGRALDTLVGPHTRLRFPLWHLHHRPMAMRPGRRGSEATERLAGRYLDAVGRPEVMRELLAEGVMCR